MQIRQTSLHAYNRIQQDGTSQTQTHKIVAFLKGQENATRHAISQALHLPINAVCGRVDELLKTHRVVICGTCTNEKTRKKNELLRYNEYVR